MKALAKALSSFVGGFSLPAYTVESVPDDVSVPYLTYPLKEPEWNKQTTFYIQGWYRTTSNADLTAKADEIISTIGAGITIPTDSGYLVIYPDTPLVQLMVDGDYRSFYINLIINSFQMPGYYPPPPTPTPTDVDDEDDNEGEDPEEGETNAET